MTPFGTRLAHAIEERGRFCVGIDPHAALLHDWGLDDDVAGTRAVRAHRGGGGRARGRRGQAAERVLRAVRQPGDRGPRAGHRRVPRGRGAGAAGRQARRHRLDQPGLRRRLPRPRLAAGLRRDHRQPLPRLRLARPDGRRLPPPRRRAVRARADLQQGGPRGAARAQRRRHGRRRRCSPTCARLNAGAEPLGSFGAVVGATIGETGEDLDINGPLPRAGLRRAGRHRRRPGAGSSARPPGWALPSSSREVLRAGPDVAALRDAARRGNDAVSRLGRVRLPRPGGCRPGLSWR